MHPENFGVIPSADDVPIFGVTDFDEAYYAPFTWDLKRGAVGFMIAAQEEGGLIEGALEDRSAWLARKYHDEYRSGFVADEEHVPVTSRTEDFQKALDGFVKDNDITVPRRAGQMRVKDVCQRLGQGTASLGLPRYYLMVEGPLADGTDDLIIEFKQARRSALAGLTPPSEYTLGGNAERITHAHGVHLVRGDRFYGAVDMDVLSFMVRERAPYRDDIDLDELSPKQWRTYRDLRCLARPVARAVGRGGPGRPRRGAGRDRRGGSRAAIRRGHRGVRYRVRRPGARRPRALPCRPRPGCVRIGRHRLPLTRHVTEGCGRLTRVAPLGRRP